MIRRTHIEDNEHHWGDAFPPKVISADFIRSMLGPKKHVLQLSRVMRAHNGSLTTKEQKRIAKHHRPLRVVR